MAEVEVRWYLDHVKVLVNEATEDVLAALGMRIVEGTQLQIRENNQIDTGFMVNSVYLVTTADSGYPQALSAAMQQTTDQEGRTVDHENDMAPEQPLAEGAAAGVVVGAGYAIYQEARLPFLYPAAERAAREFGGEAERVYKEVLPEEGPRT